MKETQREMADFPGFANQCYVNQRSLVLLNGLDPLSQGFWCKNYVFYVSSKLSVTDCTEIIPALTRCGKLIELANTGSTTASIGWEMLQSRDIHTCSINWIYATYIREWEIRAIGVRYHVVTKLMHQVLVNKQKTLRGPPRKNFRLNRNMSLYFLDEMLVKSYITLRKKRGAKTAPQRVHFLVRRTDP